MKNVLRAMDIQRMSLTETNQIEPKKNMYLSNVLEELDFISHLYTDTNCYYNTHYIFIICMLYIFK